MNYAEQLSQRIRDLEAKCAELEQFKTLFNHALDCLNQVFQVESRKPPPLLPDFLKLGEDKFRGAVRLAVAYLSELKRSRELKRALAGHLFDHESLSTREAIRSELINCLAAENEQLRKACEDLLKVFEPPSKLSDELLRKETNALRKVLRGDA